MPLTAFIIVASVRLPKSRLVHQFIPMGIAKAVRNQGTAFAGKYEHPPLKSGGFKRSQPPRFKLPNHSVISDSDAQLRKRSPSSQLPVPASSLSSSPLCPRPEDVEVQNGITVLPVKSFAFTKPFRLS